MEVILQEDVKKLGNKGEVVKVASGYARNYLLPKGLAVEATSAKLNNLKHRKKVIAKKVAKNKQAAEGLASQLAKETFVLAVKSGEKGRLFGSITTKDIADVVNKKGYEIDKRKIDLDQNIKSLGVHRVSVKIFKNVSATLTLKVVEA